MVIRSSFASAPYFSAMANSTIEYAPVFSVTRSKPSFRSRSTSFMNDS